MSSSTIRKPLLGSEPVTQGSVLIGLPHPQERIAVGVLLRRRPDSPGLPSLEELCAEPFRAPLSHEELTRRHGADPADVKAVEAFAEAHGLDVVGHDLAHRLVHLAGPGALVANAFGVQLIHVAHPRGLHRTHLGRIHLPENLLPIIKGVLGLDTRPAARPHVQVGGQPSTPRLFTPPEVAELYEFPDVTGEGQSIAVIELGGGYWRQDLADYVQRLGVPMPRITNVSVAGAGNQPVYPPGDAEAEVALDLEVVGSVAPGADITVYFAANTNYAFLLALAQAVHDSRRRHSVISISWAEAEAYWQPMVVEAMNEILWEAAVLGITICVASGDQGSSGENPPSDGWAHVKFPPSSPFALACGGTLLRADGRSIAAEVVWHEGAWSSGGGASDVFPVPPYQQQTGIEIPSINPGSKSGRGVPDLAGNAAFESPYVIELGGQLTATGGTSAVAPLMAALVARLNQKLGRRLGFLHPALYQIGRTAAAFRDIVQGNNATAPWVGGYVARPGWDACTGWGSPNGRQLLAALETLAEPPKSEGKKRRPT
ncbi:MAG TPA: S53 family peptidase [Thermoanaerobaculia bacterium]|nr:S53 family peptidase [Thermoanaerobaculia bacterium]